MNRIQIIDGPSLNMLGIREPDVYGILKYDELKEAVSSRAEELGLQVLHRQTNHEGTVIDWLQEDEFEGVLINPGAYTHTSIAISDAIAVLKAPVIEIHLTNIHARPNRNHSYTAERCKGLIAGFGIDSYLMGLEQMARLVSNDSGNSGTGKEQK